MDFTFSHCAKQCEEKLKIALQEIGEKIPMKDFGQRCKLP